MPNLGTKVQHMTKRGGLCVVVREEKNRSTWFPGTHPFLRRFSSGYACADCDLRSILLAYRADLTGGSRTDPPILSSCNGFRLRGNPSSDTALLDSAKIYIRPVGASATGTTVISTHFLAIGFFSRQLNRSQTRLSVSSPSHLTPGSASTYIHRHDSCVRLRRRGKSSLKGADGVLAGSPFLDGKLGWRTCRHALSFPSRGIAVESGCADGFQDRWKVSERGRVPVTTSS
jgi:hypothetical protein